MSQILPGHGSVLHRSVNDWSPVLISFVSFDNIQPAPPALGAGLLHDRTLVRKPPSQGLVQAVTILQSPQFPSPKRWKKNTIPWKLENLVEKWLFREKFFSMKFIMISLLKYFFLIVPYADWYWLKIWKKDDKIIKKWYRFHKKTYVFFYRRWKLKIPHCVLNFLDICTNQKKSTLLGPMDEIAILIILCMATHLAFNTLDRVVITTATFE